MTEDRNVITFGCRLNDYESQLIRQAMDKADARDVIVFNSCAVTKEAERQLRQSIRKTRREHPDKEIVVTGCAAQLHPDFYASMPEVDRVVGNKEKLSHEAYDKSKSQPTIAVSDIMQLKESAHHLLHGFEGKARCFIEIENGCNHRCTFCRIPFARGNLRSANPDHVVSHIQHVVDQGFNEVVLTGVDITDYGSDLGDGYNLGALMKRIFKEVPKLPRLRLSSIDVAEIDADLFELIEHEPRLMPHLHVSLQAGDTMILKRMKRRHVREDIFAFCEKVRKWHPDIAFGADIIAGFPTETDAMFQNTVDLLNEIGIPYLHVFPYSDVEETPAARMPQVPKQLRKERAAILREIGKKHYHAFAKKWVGQEVSAIVEEGGVGRTEHFLPVQLAEDLPLGSIKQHVVTDYDDNTGRLK